MARYTLITGASSGIGRALADIAAERRRNLILAARREAALEEAAEQIRAVYGVLVKVIPSDLSAPDGADALWREASSENRRIDFLVNNAGLGVNGAFAETDWEAEARLLAVNVTALTRLSKLAIPSMVAAGNGRILNVASTAAFIPGPNMAVYHASKAYVLSLSEALDAELEDTGVSVTALCPGATQTEFFEVADMASTRIVRNTKMPTAAAVARFGYLAAIDRKPIAVYGTQNKGLGAIARILPRSTSARMARRVLSRT